MHGDGHAAHAEIGVKANLRSLEPQDNAMLVLQRRNLCAADHREAGASRSVRASDVPGSMQVGGSPAQPCLGNADRADRDTADAERIMMAREVQHAASTPPPTMKPTLTTLMDTVPVVCA
jgi:hypothetical protein